MINRIDIIIKWVLRILIITSLLISITKNLSKAYTLDEFIEFSNIVKDLDDATAQQKQSANWVLNNQTTIKNYYGTKANTLNSWKIDYTTNSGWGWAYRITGYENGNFNGWNNQGSLDFITSQSDRYFVGQAQNINWQPNKNLGSVYTFQYCLLKDTIASNVDFTGKIGNQYYKTLKIETDLEDITINNNTYKAIRINYINNVIKLGKIIGIDENTHYINISFNSYDNKANYTNTKNLYNGYNTKEYLYIDDNMDVYISYRYLAPNIKYNLYVDCFTDSTFTVETGNTEEYYYTINYNATIENGTITNIGSGEQYTEQDSTNAIIQNNNEISNKWEEIYNGLFTIEPEQLQGLFFTIKEQLAISGDFEIEEEIIQMANARSGDFKITWESYTPNFTIKGIGITQEKPMIPSGEINFTKIERENPSLQQTMHWARIILSFSIITLILREYLKILYDITGASVLLADHDKTSNKIVDKGDKTK